MKQLSFLHHMAIAIAVFIGTGSAAAGDWTLYTKEMPKSPWKKNAELDKIEPWPAQVAGACHVSLAGGNHEIKVENAKSGEKRQILCDDLNAMLEQRLAEAAKERQAQPQPKQGTVKLW